MNDEVNEWSWFHFRCYYVIVKGRKKKIKETTPLPNDPVLNS
jgi:hypothetical protein